MTTIKFKAAISLLITCAALLLITGRPANAQPTFTLLNAVHNVKIGTTAILRGRVQSADAGWQLTGGNATLSGAFGTVSDVQFGAIPLLEDLGANFDSGPFTALTFTIPSSATEGDLITGNVQFDFENVATGAIISSGSNFTITSVTTIAAPEPGSLSVLAAVLPLMGMALIRRRVNRR